MATLLKRNTPKKGEIWLVNDKKSNKARPFFILSDELSGIDVDVSVAPATTHEKRNAFDIEIKYWKEAGLSEPSFGRCSKVHYVHHTFLMRKLGNLDERDMHTMDEALRKFFKL